MQSGLFLFDNWLTFLLVIIPTIVVYFLPFKWATNSTMVYYLLSADVPSNCRSLILRQHHFLGALIGRCHEWTTLNRSDNSTVFPDIILSDNHLILISLTCFQSLCWVTLLKLWKFLSTVPILNFFKRPLLLLARASHLLLKRYAPNYLWQLLHKLALFYIIGHKLTIFSKFAWWLYRRSHLS